MRYLIVIIIFIFLSAKIQSQCTCELPSFETSLKNTNDIFVGIVERKALNSEVIHKEDKRGRGIKNTFTVQGVISGDFKVGEEVSCLSGLGEDDKGFEFVLGKSYIIFHEAFIDSCTHSQIYSRQKVNEIKKILNDTIIKIRPPGLYNFETIFFKYQNDEKFYQYRLVPKFAKRKDPSIELSKEELIKEFRFFINNELNLKDGYVRFFVAFKHDGSVYLYGAKPSQGAIAYCEKELLDFYQTNYIAKTKGYDCLLDRTIIELYIDF